MPCITDPDPSEVRENNRKLEIKRLKSLLCSACRSLETSGFDFAVNPLLDEWWDAHQKEEQARAIRKAKEKRAFFRATELANTKPVGSMTDEEKSLLRRFKII